MSRAKQRGTSSWFEVFRVRLWFPELFSWLFYVAASRLNSPRLSPPLIRLARRHCQARGFHRRRPSVATEFEGARSSGTAGVPACHVATSELGCDEMQARTPAVPEERALKLHVATKGFHSLPNFDVNF
jgi:hypothetical protein